MRRMRALGRVQSKRCRLVSPLFCAIAIEYYHSGSSAAVLQSPSLKSRAGSSSQQSQIVAALKRCAKFRDLEGGKKVHEEAIASGMHRNSYIAASLIAMYSKCRSMALARQVFDGMIRRDVVTWTSLILGYAENGESLVAMDLFFAMDCKPDSFTYVAALKACGGLAIESGKRSCLEKGMAIHKQVTERGFDSNIFVANTLVDMYSNCGSMDRARQVFDRMVSKDVVTWNSLILGYVQNGENSAALDMFAAIDCEPNSLTYVAAMKACAGLASSEESEASEKKKFCLSRGVAIHDQVKGRGLGSEIVLATSLVDMYSKCGNMDLARDVFDSMVSKDVVTWNSLLMGYVQNGESLVALDLFIAGGMECEPNSLTYVALLKACGSLAALPAGRWFHARICRLGLEQDRVLWNTLMDFYGKCGSMSKAEELLSNMDSPDIVSWTNLIAGFSSLGDSVQVFSVMREMQRAGLEMDAITFTCVLTACSHAGLVEEGKRYFEMIRRSSRGVSLSVEHYNCMVDMLGRANRLQEAVELIESMPFRANTVTWTTLLGACRKWKNAEIGKVAFDALVAAGTTDSAAYVLMSEIFSKSSEDMEEAGEQITRTTEGMDAAIHITRRNGATGKTENMEEGMDAAIQITRRAKTTGRGQEQTWWCDSTGKTLEFVDPIIKEEEEQHQIGNAAHGSEDFDSESLKTTTMSKKKKDPMCGSSFKLALAHALDHTGPGETLRFVKNTRVCSDCHHFTKQISKAENRQIILRDVIRFHVFQEGSCSCADYW